MVRITRVFGGHNHELALIQLPSEDNTNVVKSYIIDRSNTFYKEEIDFDAYTVAFFKDTLFMRSDCKQKTFFFVYDNFLFKIEGAKAVKVIDFPSSEAEKNEYVLLIFTNTLIEFYSFSTEYVELFKLLGSLDNAYTHYFFNSGFNSNNFSLKLIFKNGYYYIDYICDISNLLKDNKTLHIVRFNPYILQEYTILGNAKAIINPNQKHYGLPQYFITSFGIFDVFNFELFNLQKMFEIIGKSYVDLFYEFFSTTDGKRFVFVSEKFIDFSAFENSKFSKEYQYGDTVNGMLYDLNAEEFIFPAIKHKNSGKRWLKFFIYDSGIPHVFEINSSELKAKVHEYAVVFFDAKKQKFSKIITTDLPTFISHIYAQKIPNVEKVTTENHLEIIRKRIIFANIKNKKLNVDDERITANHSIIVIDDKLRIVTIDNFAIFEAAITHKTTSSYSNERRLYTAFIDSQNTTKNTSNIDIITQAKSKGRVLHLLQNDSIIFKSYKGELGEYILLTLDNALKIEYTLSFFKYCMFTIVILDSSGNSEKTKFLKVMCRRNDFENKTYIINPSTYQIFEYEDFVAYVAKNFFITL